MKAKTLAGILAADALRDESRVDSIFNKCFSCRRGMVYRVSSGDDSGRFCSAKCREWYDAGNRPIDQIHAAVIPLPPLRQTARKSLAKSRTHQARKSRKRQPSTMAKI